MVSCFGGGAGSDEDSRVNQSSSSDAISYCSFERPPFVATFSLGAKEVYFFGLHVKPDRASSELNILDDAIESVVGDVSESEIVAFGDFNADCDYLSDSEYNSLDLISKGYIFPIGKDGDTNVASSRCAYDVFAVHLDEVTQNNPVIYSSMPSEVSDHYPIGLTLEVEGKDMRSLRLTWRGTDQVRRGEVNSSLM